MTTTLTARLPIYDLITRAVRANEVCNSSPCNCGVCVMPYRGEPNWTFEPLISLVEQARRARADDERERASVQDHDHQYVMPLNLPLAQKIALLWMRFDSPFAKAAIQAIDELPDSPIPAWKDFSALVDMSWAKRENSNRHRLTISGEHAADMVARDLCKRIGVHLKIELGDDRYTCKMACTCGETFSFSKNQGHIASQRMRAWSGHIEARSGAKIIRGLFDKATGIPEVVSPPTQPEG